MFVFLGIHFSEHPDYYELLRKGEDATLILTDKLWKELADNLVCCSGFGHVLLMNIIGALCPWLGIRRRRRTRYRWKGVWLLSFGILSGLI